MNPAPIEFLWPERLTDAEMKSLMVSIEESRSAFMRQCFDAIDAMPDQVDREMVALLQCNGAPCTCPTPGIEAVR